MTRQGFWEAMPFRAGDDGMAWSYGKGTIFGNPMTALMHRVGHRLSLHVAVFCR